MSYFIISDFCNEMKDVRYFTFPTFAACEVDGAFLGRAAETAEFEDGYMFWLISKPDDDEILKVIVFHFLAINFYFRIGLNFSKIIINMDLSPHSQT